MNLTRKHLLAQVFSGHRDMRDLHEAMLLLNDNVKRAFDLNTGVFSFLLMKRIAGFSIPLMFKQCHAYFYNAMEQLKIPKEVRNAQGILMRRYDVRDIESVSLDLIFLRNQQVSQIMNHGFEQVNNEYVPEHFYPQEFRPALQARIVLFETQIQFYQNSWNFDFPTEFSNLGLFSIGFPFPPTKVFYDLENNIPSKLLLDSGNNQFLTQYFDTFLENKCERVIELAKFKNRRISVDIHIYRWHIALWVLEAENAPFKQANCDLETQICKRKVRYTQVVIDRLPFFFGEYSEFCHKNLRLFNQMDDSIQGMHLCLDLLSTPDAANIISERKLAVINYSCNGWSLRVQLLPGRKWLVSTELVFEIDPPECTEEDQTYEEDFEQHFVYECILTFHPQDYRAENIGKVGTKKARSIKSGKIEKWSELQKLYIVIREFGSKEVLDILRPGDAYDAVRIIVYDRWRNRDVTEAAVKSREGMEEVEETGEWEVCLGNEYPDENVFVWARKVDQSLRTTQYSHIPIQYFATYFEWDPIYSEKELSNAPTQKITGADVLSYGTQKFKVLLHGSAEVQIQQRLGQTSSVTPSEQTKATDSDRSTKLTFTDHITLF